MRLYCYKTCAFFLSSEKDLSGENTFILNSSINSRALLKKVTVSSINKSNTGGNTYSVKFSLSSSVSSYAGGIAFSSYSFNAGAYFFVGLISLINTTKEEGSVGGKNVIGTSGTGDNSDAPTQNIRAAYFNTSYTTFTVNVASKPFASSSITLHAEDFYVLK